MKKSMTLLCGCNIESGNEKYPDKCEIYETPVGKRVRRLMNMIDMINRNFNGYKIQWFDLEHVDPNEENLLESLHKKEKI